VKTANPSRKKEEVSSPWTTGGNYFHSSKQFGSQCAARQEKKKRKGRKGKKGGDFDGAEVWLRKRTTTSNGGWGSAYRCEPFTNK